MVFHANFPSMSLFTSFFKDNHKIIVLVMLLWDFYPSTDMRHLARCKFFFQSLGSLQNRVWTLNFTSPAVLSAHFLSLVTEFTVHIQYPIPQNTHTGQSKTSFLIHKYRNMCLSEAISQPNYCLPNEQHRCFWRKKTSINLYKNIFLDFPWNGIIIYPQANK